MTTPRHKTAYMIVGITFILSALFILVHQANVRIEAQETAQAEIRMQALAQAGKYQPLAPLPGFNEQANGNTNMTATLRFIFRWGIAVAVILSVLMTIVGGIQYMTTDAWSKKEDGKERIKAAIAGLLLALSAWLILNTINPKILQPPESQLLK